MSIDIVICSISDALAGTDKALFNNDTDKLVL